MKTIAYLSIAAAVGIATARAQTLTPLPIQQPDMPTLIQGLTELPSLPTNAPFYGAAIVVSGPENPGLESFHIIDRLYNQTPYPWSNEPNNPSNNPTNAPWYPPQQFPPPNEVPDYAIVDFTGTNANTVSNTVGMIVLEGRLAGASAGTYTFEYTTDQPPIGYFSTWTTIGTYTWSSTNPLPEVAFVVTPIHGVTGFQLQTLADDTYNTTNANAGQFNSDSVQQLGIYSPPTNAPVIVNQPQGTNAYDGYTVNLDVSAVYGTQFQWYKNGSTFGVNTNILVIHNAQSTDSGTYKVVVQNSAGSVTSSNAVVNITALPPTVLNEQPSILFGWTNLVGYTYAVQGSANLGGPYTTVSNWTVNVGNLVETAIPQSAVAGDKYFQLTLLSHP